MYECPNCGSNNVASAPLHDDMYWLIACRLCGTWVIERSKYQAMMIWDTLSVEDALAGQLLITIEDQAI